MVFKTKYNKTKNKTEYIQAKYYVEMPPTLPNKAASLFKAQGKLKVHRNTKQHFLSSYFIASDSHIKVTWLHIGVFISTFCIFCINTLSNEIAQNCLD